MGLVNAFDEAAVQRKLRELDQTPRKPILLGDVPLEEAIPSAEYDPKFLIEVEGAMVLPPVRRKPFNYSEIINYIRQNYTPDPNGVNGYRIWRPKHVF